MKVPIDVRCLECRQIFCCADCRRKHEEKEHNITFECHLCRYSLFILDPNVAHCGELIDHIESKHLPLHCLKCKKIFDKVEQFFEDSRCSKENFIQDKCDKIESEPKCVMSSIMPESVDILKKKCGHLRKDDKSAVMTSTPTHSNVPNWGLLQKSFTSTLSGINSPDSDVAQSPTENDKITSANQLSSIQADSSSNLKMKELKGIMSKGVRSKLEHCDSCEKPNIVYDVSHPERTDSVNSDKGSPGSEANQDFTPSIINSSDKRKKVTFAEDVDERKHAKIKPYSHAHLKTKRIPTPCRIVPKRSRTPRLQAIINNFESRSSKMVKTPKMRNPALTNDTTPPSTEQNIVTARTINFKESPTLSEDSSKRETVEEAASKAESSTSSKLDTTDGDLYKSCLHDSISQDDDVKSALNTVNDLPKQIADSIQESLSNALESGNYSTEIQFKIVITKKVVSIKETSKALEDSPVRDRVRKSWTKRNHSTTIWSRLMSGMKWVIWGDDANRSSEDLYVEAKLSPDTSIMSSCKRKRILTELSESPISNKRYRYSGRICGRRPLDRMLKGGNCYIERSNSAGVDATMKTEDKNKSLNQSF